VWAPQPVWTFWRRTKSLSPTGIRTPDRPACSVVAVSTTLWKRFFKSFAFGTNIVQRRTVSTRLHQRHISTDCNLQDYLLFLIENCLVPAHVVLVANCDGRKREILDREICTLKHSHGWTGLIPCPDVWRCVECSGDSDGAQYYPDTPASSNSSYVTSHRLHIVSMCLQP
jgi:hypothetical protein